MTEQTLTAIHEMQITDTGKETITNILEKIQKEAKGNKRVRLMESDEFYPLLNDQEASLAKRIASIDPSVYEFHGPFLGMQKVPENLVEINDQEYMVGSETKKLNPRYLPQPVFLAYQNLNDALHEDTGRKLLIASGYRSPAYQLVNVLWFLRANNFDFAKTIKEVALPGYSEHSYPERQAIDFMTQDEDPNNQEPLEFAKTREYKWLLENAEKFGFHLSYPIGNNQGVAFEPWHWHYEAKD